MDFVDLASKIEILIENKELCDVLSKNSIEVLVKISNRENVKNTQLLIYNDLLRNVCNNNN